MNFNVKLSPSVQQSKHLHCILQKEQDKYLCFFGKQKKQIKADFLNNLNCFKFTVLNYVIFDPWLISCNITIIVVQNCLSWLSPTTSSSNLLEILGEVSWGTSVNHFCYIIWAKAHACNRSCQYQPNPRVFFF